MIIYGRYSTHFHTMSESARFTALTYLPARPANDVSGSLRWRIRFLRFLAGGTPEFPAYWKSNGSTIGEFKVWEVRRREAIARNEGEGGFSRSSEPKPRSERGDSDAAHVIRPRLMGPSLSTWVVWPLRSLHCNFKWESSSTEPDARGAATHQT